MSKLAELRKANGWTQRDLTEMTGYSSSTISKVETGRSRMTLSMAIDISKKLGLKIEDILDDFESQYSTIDSQLLLQDLNTVLEYQPERLTYPERRQVKKFYFVLDKYKDLNFILSNMREEKREIIKQISALLAERYPQKKIMREFNAYMSLGQVGVERESLAEKAIEDLKTLISTIGYSIEQVTIHDHVSGQLKTL